MTSESWYINGLVRSRGYSRQARTSGQEARRRNDTCNDITGKQCHPTIVQIMRKHAENSCQLWKRDATTLPGYDPLRLRSPVNESSVCAWLHYLQEVAVVVLAHGIPQ